MAGNPDLAVSSPVDVTQGCGAMASEGFATLPEKLYLQQCSWQPWGVSSI